MLAYFNARGGLWTFGILVCFVLFLAFGYNWVA
jgi:hypothetical protein